MTKGPLACVALDRSALAERFGAPVAANEVCAGIGTYDAWDLRPGCGIAIGVMAFRTALRFDGTMVEPALNAEITADTDDIDHVLFHLGATGGWRDPDIAPAPVVFAVRRSDDNGGEYEVARYTSRCEAEAAVAELTARGHKQMYWVERARA